MLYSDVIDRFIGGTIYKLMTVLTLNAEELREVNLVIKNIFGKVEERELHTKH